MHPPAYTYSPAQHLKYVGPLLVKVKGRKNSAYHEQVNNNNNNNNNNNLQFL